MIGRTVTAAVVAAFVLVEVVGCARTRELAPDPTPSATPTATPKSTPTSNASTSWRDRFDFDGDGQVDRIDVSFSGGAHCCYTLAVDLSRSAHRVDVPFELDGGYVGGLSLANPDAFDVRVGPDGVAAFFMHVATYAGTDEPIPIAWRRAYGFRTNRILVDLRSGAVHATDA